MKCVQCQKDANVIASWQTSRGAQECALCEKCCAALWNQHGRSTLFNFKPLPAP